MILKKYTDFAARAMNGFFGVALTYVDENGTGTELTGTIKLGPNELMLAGGIGFEMQPAVIRIAVGDLPVDTPAREHRIHDGEDVYQPLAIPGVGCYERNESWVTIYTKKVGA